MGQFYGKMVNLDEEIQTLNETVVMESKFSDETILEKSELIVTIEPERNLDGIEEVEDEVEESPVRWRPPTPPKATPPKGTKIEMSEATSDDTSVTNIVPPLFTSVIEGDSRTPTPPVLISTVIMALKFISFEIGAKN